MKRALVIFLLLVSVLSIGWVQSKGSSSALKEIVESERAFARLGAEKGVRESFLTYFAEDCIFFSPHPVNAKEALRASPVTPPRFTLNWAPVYGDISQDGDWGYLTGPTMVSERSGEKKPVSFGQYFSVWKKQADGKYLVILDAGIGVPSLVTPLDTPFRSAPPVANRKPSRPASSSGNASDILIEKDRAFLQEVKTRGIERGYTAYLSDTARVHRNGTLPLTEKQAVRAWLATQTQRLIGEPMKAVIANSGDLGYVYGRYELQSSDGQAVTEKSYYVRIWRLEENGTWRIVFDTNQPPLPK